MVKLSNKLDNAPYADINKRSEYENIEDELQRLSDTYIFDVVVRKPDFTGSAEIEVTNIIRSELISQHQGGNYLRQTRVWYCQIDFCYCTVSFCTIIVLFVELFFIQLNLFDYLFIYLFFVVC